MLYNMHLMMYAYKSVIPFPLVDSFQLWQHCALAGAMKKMKMKYFDKSVKFVLKQLWHMHAMKSNNMGYTSLNLKAI